MQLGFKMSYGFKTWVTSFMPLRNYNPLPAHIVTKLINSQQNYAQRFYKPTKLHPNQTLNMGRDKNLFMSVCNMAFTLSIFTKLKITQWISVDNSCTKFYPSWMKNVKNMSTILFYILHKVCPSLHWFSQNQQWYNGIMWIASVPNFIQISQEICKTQGNSLTPVCKVWLRLCQLPQKSHLLNNIS